MREREKSLREEMPKEPKKAKQTIERKGLEGLKGPKGIAKRQSKGHRLPKLPTIRPKGAKMP